MRKVDGELDQMMWMIAEQGDSRAIDEFEARHPELRYELSKRMSMVRQLKSAGKAAHQAPSVPVFRPQEARRSTPSRRTLAGVGLLGLAALAAASYTVVTFLEPPPKPAVSNPAPRQIDRTPAPTPPPTDPVAPPPAVVESTPQAVDETPAYLKPQDLKIDHAPLTVALKMIGAQGGIQVEIGPGLADPTIQIEYHGRTTIDMLKDLGRQYAFTAFDQGDGSVLVIPAVDPSNPPERVGKDVSTDTKPIQKAESLEHRILPQKPEHRS